MKIRPVGAELCRVDRHDQKLFRNLANAFKQCIYM